MSAPAASGGPAGAAHPPGRIGVAIPVPSPTGELLQRCRADSGDVLAWSVPTHVTLVPPVAVADEHLPQVDAHLARVASCTRPFRIRLRGTGTFRPVSPVAYVRLVAGAAEVSRIEHHLRHGPLAGERRFPFHPHVTLAQGVGDEALDRAVAALAGFEAAFPVEGYLLYRHDGDGVWRAEAEYRLG